MSVDIQKYVISDNEYTEWLTTHPHAGSIVVNTLLNEIGFAVITQMSNYVDHLHH